MKTIIVIISLSCGLIFSNISHAQEFVSEDQQAIMDVIQTAYVEGLQNEGDLEKVDSGFHPGFELLGIGNGNQMWKLPIYNWKESTEDAIKEGKKPRKDDELVSVKFLSVDVSGTAASVKLEFYVAEKLTFIDYLSLYKFEDGWKIVSKIFYKFPEKEEK